MSRTAPPFWYVMPSNAFSMSSFDSMGWRMRRAVTSESTSIANERVPTRATREPQSGFQRPMILLPIHVAKDSFSHTSSHQAIVTRSPNHWCAVSWAQTLAYRRRKRIVSSAGFERMDVETYVTRPGFSIAPNPTVWGITRWSSFSYGYGMSK